MVVNRHVGFVGIEPVIFNLTFMFTLGAVNRTTAMHFSPEPSFPFAQKDCEDLSFFFSTQICPVMPRGLCLSSIQSLHLLSFSCHRGYIREEGKRVTSPLRRTECAPCKCVPVCVRGCCSTFNQELMVNLKGNKSPRRLLCRLYPSKQSVPSAPGFKVFWGQGNSSDATTVKTKAKHCHIPVLTTAITTFSATIQEPTCTIWPAIDNVYSSLSVRPSNCGFLQFLGSRANTWWCCQQCGFKGSLTSGGTFIKCTCSSKSPSLLVSLIQLY